MVSPPTSEPSPRAPRGETGPRERALLAWFDGARARLPLAPNGGRSLRRARVRGDAPADAGLARGRGVPRFMARFPTVARRWRTPRAPTSCGRGRGWATTAGPSRCTRRPARSCAITGRGAARAGRRSARCPGSGPYTAAAVASIAYGVPVAAVDTNVRKVVARLDHGAERDEITAAQAADAAASWLDRRRPGDWNQALMTLGRAVCRTTPRCDVCPARRVVPVPRERSRGRASVRPPAALRGVDAPGAGRVVVDVLRTHPSITLGRLSALSGHPEDRVRAAVDGLAPRRGRGGIGRGRWRAGRPGASASRASLPRLTRDAARPSAAVMRMRASLTLCPGCSLAGPLRACCCLLGGSPRVTLERLAGPT